MHFDGILQSAAASPTINRNMISLLQEFARDHQSALVDFGQVFLASAILVAIAGWAKWRLLPNRANSIARKPRQPKARQNRSVLVKRQAANFEVPVATIAKNVPSGPPVMRPMSPEMHLQRAVSCLGSKIAHGERAQDLHGRAFVRLESVDYAFQRLLLDITPFVSLNSKGDVPLPAPPMIDTPEQHTVRLAA